MNILHNLSHPWINDRHMYDMRKQTHFIGSFNAEIKESSVVGIFPKFISLNFKGEHGEYSPELEYLNLGTYRNEYGSQVEFEGMTFAGFLIDLKGINLTMHHREDSMIYRYINTTALGDNKYMGNYKLVENGV